MFEQIVKANAAIADGVESLIKGITGTTLTDTEQPAPKTQGAGIFKQIENEIVKASSGIADGIEFLTPKNELAKLLLKAILTAI
ncbi:MAG: hypothetical protein ACK5ME_09955, partial [Parahaliea sp.]